MSRSTDDWKALYEPMLNQRLSGMWFYPVTCDTPDVVRDLHEAVIAFSGAVCLGFDNRSDHYLTWQQIGGATFDFELSSYDREDGDWGRASVDRICMSAEDPWGRILGGQLTKVEIYSCTGTFSEPLVGPITTAAHHLRTPSGDAVLWVSTATGSIAGSGDDMLASIDCDLTDPERFKLAVTIQ